MRIYVASSWRNAHQPAVVAELRRAGHDVYDFRNPAPGNDGFRWSAITPVPKPWAPERLAEVLRHPIAQAGFGYDMDALRACDACVLVLPCGRSAHLELGWAAGAGKRTTVLMLEPDEPEADVPDARSPDPRIDQGTRVLGGALRCRARRPLRRTGRARVAVVSGTGSRLHEVSGLSPWRWAPSSETTEAYRAARAQAARRVRLWRDAREPRPGLLRRLAAWLGWGAR